jgi:hypothetical protein
MKAIEFEQQTLLLGPPKGSERGTCGALPVLVQDGAFQSFWKPTPEEIEALKAGGHIRLVVYGGGHPPVWIDAVPMGYAKELP